MRKLKLALAVSWFAVSAVVSVILWLLTLPYRLWRPVMEKAIDWVEICLDHRWPI